MNAFWTYFWPAFGFGAAAGVIAGAIAFRKGSKRNAVLAAGFDASVLLAAAWHGPFGGADRFSTKVGRGIRATFAYYEVTQIDAHLERDPLTRRIELSGPADDFQKSELVRLMDELPGVSSTTWSHDDSGVPLIAQGALVSILGFLLGVFLAYLVALRRRYNAQWNW
jgi:hypothetical protein